MSCETFPVLLSLLLSSSLVLLSLLSSLLLLFFKPFVSHSTLSKVAKYGHKYTGLAAFIIINNNV